MLKLLHVDDDADILELAKMSLELMDDIEVVDCVSGEEALTTVEEFKPDVFLLDVMMPGMSGPETLEKLRQVPGLEAVPAIFMTARVGVGAWTELFDLGVAEVIAKPFDPMTLGAQIKAVLHR
ncbi:response regulator [Sulfitobacter sp. NFXS29]|uniref:response regulator n=1 Tax=Sulfitobacter sp. NFXS29 TaxID=2818438 RepID=UPI0032DF3317